MSTPKYAKHRELRRQANALALAQWPHGEAAVSTWPNGTRRTLRGDARRIYKRLKQAAVTA